MYINGTKNNTCLKSVITIDGAGLLIAWKNVVASITKPRTGVIQKLIRSPVIPIERISKDIFKLNKKMCSQIISCGFAFFVAQMAMAFISLVYNSQLGKYGGDIAISVYAVISSIMTLVIMPASGISQGIQPIVGNNYGSGNFKRVFETLVKATILSVGITCVIWIIVLISPKQILASIRWN